MSEFKLPDVGEGLTEAEIVTWRVAVGDTVKVNDILVDIETAKSIVELPSPYEGQITALLAAEGDTVTVGTPIVTVGADAPETAGAVTGRQPVLVGYGPLVDAPTRRRRRMSSVDGEKVDGEKVPQAPLRVLAKPPVRKLAKDLGVDLTDLPVTGEVITRADVEAHASLRHGDGGPEPSVSMTHGDGDVRIPIKGVRKQTAHAMVKSAFTAPHVTEWLTLDVSRTMDLVARLRTDRSFAGLKVSPTLIVAKAVCLAMRRTPELNATWDEQSQEIIVRKSINLGIAAATDRGLVVPTIAAAESLSLVELAAALGELTETARAGRTQPAQMRGGTFSITNIGVFGVDAGTPILNPDQAGILALGAITRRPWVDDDDRVVPRWVTTAVLSFDHRVVDGEQGSRFLTDVAAILRDPALALAY